MKRYEEELEVPYQVEFHKYDAEEEKLIYVEPFNFLWQYDDYTLEDFAYYYALPEDIGSEFVIKELASNKIVSRLPITQLKIKSINERKKNYGKIQH